MKLGLTVIWMTVAVAVLRTPGQVNRDLTKSEQEVRKLERPKHF